jgi:hypothetical protein
MRSPLDHPTCMRCGPTPSAGRKASVVFAKNVFMVVGSPLSYSDMACAGIHTAGKIGQSSLWLPAVARVVGNTSTDAHPLLLLAMCAAFSICGERPNTTSTVLLSGTG